MEEKRTADDEISLVDILKVLWKYKYFIIIFCIIGFLISFVILYTLDFNKKNQNTNSFNYSFKIYLKSISYEFYNNFKLNLNYDYNTNYLKNNFNIASIRVSSKELKKEEYTKNDFPIGSIILNITFNQDISEELKKNLFNYLKDLLFKSAVLDIIESLKVTEIKSSSNNNNIINFNFLELNLFLAQLYKDLSLLFSLKNNDLIKDYEIVKDYLSNKLSLDQNLSKAISLLISAIDKQYQIINNFNLDYEKIQNNKITVLKDIIKKEIIILIFLFFFSIFLVFVIDFFKKNWKEITG